MSSTPIDARNSTEAKAKVSDDVQDQGTAIDSDNHNSPENPSTSTSSLPIPTTATSTTNNPNATEASTGGSGTSKSQQAYTTEIVKCLFGRDGTSGVVVGDYSCTSQRQSGRLYVATDALFFYSNLFGFEKRIRIQYDDAIMITKLRSTSLFVKTLRGDDHVFKSFQDRDAVLDVILKFHKPSANNPALNSDSDNELATPNLAFEDKKEDDVGINDTDLITTELQTNVKADPASALPTEYPPSIDETNTRSTEENKLVDEASIQKSKVLAWEKLKETANSLGKSAVTDFNLPFNSARGFFEQFLSDEAPFSLNVFQTDVIGDKNVTIDTWKEGNPTGDDQSADEYLSRTIQLDHKAGYSVAHVTRQQTYQRYGNNAILRNVTNIKGIPQAEVFFVEDMWSIERIEKKGIFLNVKFRVQFTKSSMLKSIIESRAKAETLEYYDKFTSFLKSNISIEAPVNVLPTLNVEGQNDEVDISETPQTKSAILLQFFAISPNSWVAGIFVALIVFIYYLRWRILKLEDSIQILNARLTQLEDERVASCNPVPDVYYEDSL